MTNAEKIVDAVRGAGGRISRAELKAISELEGQALDSGIYLAKKEGWIAREGADYVLLNAPAAAAGASTPPHSKKPRKTPGKPAAKAKQARALTLAKPRTPATHQAGDCRAVATLGGGAIVIDNGFVIAELAAPQVAAVCALFWS